MHKKSWTEKAIIFIVLISILSAVDYNEMTGRLLSHDFKKQMYFSGTDPNQYP